MSFPHAVFLVWLRYFEVFKKNILYAMVTTFAEPFLYLASFGFGLGGIIGDIKVGELSVSYRAFVLAGIVAQTVLFQGFFEAAYGGFVRMYYQKIFQAIAMTPVTLSEVLWGELAWDASRATLSAAAVLAVGAAAGDFSISGALLLLPFCFFAGLIFAAMGLLVASKSRTIESISYPQYLLIFPMFLFCGIFFPISNLPVAVRTIVSVLPLTPVVSLIRTLTLGFPFEPWLMAILLLTAAILVPLAHRSMHGRLVS